MDASGALHAVALPAFALLGRGTTLVGAFLLTYAVHSTVLLLTAWWLVTRPRLAWAPAAQHAIWGVALVGGWVTAAAQLASPWQPLGGALELPRASSDAVAALRVVQDAPSPETRRSSAVVRLQTLSERPALALPLRPTSHAARASISKETTGLRVIVLAVSRNSVAVAAWACVAMLLLAQLALSRRRLLASLAARRDASDSLAGSALRHLAKEAGTTRPVTLSVSDALPSPAAISRREIVVPTRLLHDLTLAEQEGVLAHELAHVARRDPDWLRLVTWIERVAWFQPLNRMARRQMQLSAEFAADAWAARVTRQPLRLAQALARVADWMSIRPNACASHAPGFDGSPLVERVRRLTAPHHARPDVGGHLAHAAMWMVTAGVLLVLPRVNATSAGARALQRVERVFFHVADETSARTPATLSASGAQGQTQGSATSYVPRVRIVRLDGAERGLYPAAALDSSALPGPIRRTFIVTSRAKS